MYLPFEKLNTCTFSKRSFMPSLTEIEPNQFDFGEVFNIKVVE